MRGREIEESLNVGNLLAVLRRRWWIVVTCMVVTGGSAFFFSVVQRKEYTASSSLLFGDPGFAQMVFGSSFSPPDTDPTRQAATNIDLVSLPAVAARTSAALRGRLSTAQIESEVSIGSGQGDVTSITATDSSPSRAAAVANTYARQYIGFRRQAERSTINGAEAQIQQQLAALTPQEQASSVGQSLLNRGNQLRILASLQTGDAELVQRATTPGSPSSPQTKRNTIFGVLLGLLLGLSLSFLVDRMDWRLRDLAEVEDAYGAPVLAAVPYQSAFKLSPRPGSLPAADAEIFRLLRARLRYFNVDRNLSSLLITSAAPGEGKTMVALNLAIAEAVAGRARVALVEADLRRPNLARSLDIAQEPGLADVISGNARIESALQRVPVFAGPNGSGPGVTLNVIVAGPVPPNPAELIESQSMKRLLATLSEQFDLVVLDSPPVSVVSDAIPLIRQVSGVVVVSRVGETSRDAALHLREELRSLDAPILGVVANGAPTRRPDYHAFGYGSGGGSSNGAASEHELDRLALADLAVEPASEASHALQPGRARHTRRTRADT